MIFKSKLIISRFILPGKIELIIPIRAQNLKAIKIVVQYQSPLLHDTLLDDGFFSAEQKIITI
jgi:hypothetical protein